MENMRRAKDLSNSNPDLWQASAYQESYSAYATTYHNHDIEVQQWNDIPVPLRTKSSSRRSRPRSANLDIVNAPLERSFSNQDLRMPDDPTAPDAAWKKIQQNTFTRWCNEHLKVCNLFIYNLETDLQDGLKLIALLQVLAHKKVGRYNKKPTFPPQKRENVAIALKFIENEKIKLVNIDASDIGKGNLKLILGLIWTLILKYQISMPMMDDDDEASGLTPKQALLGWVKSKLPPEVKVNNFAKDWNNGIALASLVDSTAPGLFPEWEDLDPKNKLENATEAMKRAEDWLGVPQVITPEEITNPNVDELSVMTYVSFFPEAKLKPGAPIKQKMSDASKCHAHGPGIEPTGVVVNTDADFTIESTGSSRGKINVLIFAPGKQQIECNIQDNHDNTFSCRYLPPKPGTYDVHIRVGSHHIPKSPFRVKVSSDTDATKVFARGPGIEPTGVIVGRPAKFEIVATGAGSGDAHIDVIDPKGGKKTEVHIDDKGNGIYSCQYLPTMVGKYVICIKYGGTEIQKSPFRVAVDQGASRVKIFGAGLEPGLKTGKPAVFTVDCSAVGTGSVDVKIEGPGSGDVPCNVEDNGDGTYTCTYKPGRPGTYIVKVKYDGTDVPRSPVKVTISTSADLSKIKAWGPGLEKGVAGLPAEFYVEAKSVKLDSLSFAVEGPSKARVEVSDSGEYQCTVKYFPEEIGEYTVHILCEELDIPNSPYKVKVTAAGNAGKVYAEGAGLKPGCMVGQSADFKIFTHKAGGEGIVDVTCTDEDGKPAEVKLKDNRDGTYSVSYMPLRPGKYTVTIKFNSKNIQKSPFLVPITAYCDPSKVKAEGPGLKGGKANKPAKFSIDASKAGDGGIGLTIEGPKESKINCDDHGDGTCSVEYLPEEDGEYTINILFAEKHIPGSPYKAVISSDFDAAKVKVYGAGIEPGCKAGKPCSIYVDTRKAGKAKMAVEVEDEARKRVKVEEEEEEPGLYKVTYYPLKPGKHTVKVTFGLKEVPKSPFKVKIEPGADASKVKVTGPGIEPRGVCAGTPTYFIIDASEAGDGEVDVGIEPEDAGMPKVRDINVEKGDKPNVYRVTYVAPKEGKYSIPVKFAGESVPKSPFKISVKPGVDASKCKAYGPGLEEAIIAEDNPFTVECLPEAGPGELTVEVENPDGSKTDIKVKDKKDDKYKLTWSPLKEGKHKVYVKFGGQDIPKSPFKVGALPKGDASKVKVYGPGLEKAVVNRPNEFTINTKKAGAGNLGLAVEGPAEAKIKCTDNNDGTCSVQYVPVEEGDYDINIKFAEQHIPGSPFVVPATFPVDASKVKCRGPGLEKTVTASLPREFTVDAKEAGSAPLEVEITGPDRKKRTPVIKDNKDNTYNVSYVPDLEGRYTIGVKYGGDSVPQSPFRVESKPSGDASKCKVNGAGIERPNVGKPAPFEVDAKRAGKGKVTPTVKNPHGEEVPVTCDEVEEGVFACSWTPEEAGPHEVDVSFGGRPVKGSPFKPVAVDGPDTSPIDTSDLERLLADEPVIDIPVESALDCSEMPEGELVGTVKTPSGKKERVPVTDNGDGSYNIDYTPKELGLYILEITYGGAHVPGSPFKFKVVEPSPSKVKVYGPGLKKGYVGRPNAFVIDSKSAGPGNLSLAVEGPSKADVECVDNGDGTCTATYTPTEPGKYDIVVQFADKNVPGSPFKVGVVEEEPILEVGKPADVNMAPADVRPSEITTLEGVLAAPSGKEAPVEFKEGPNRTLNANFTPKEAGPNKLAIKKRGKDIKDSPVGPLLVRDKPVVGLPCEVPMELADVKRPTDVKKLKGSITRPNGKEEPCEIKVYPDDTISATFVPREPGKHLLNVKKNNKHVADSPFVIVVEAPAGGLPTVGNPCDVNLEIPDLKMPDDLKKVKAILKRPSGTEEPIDVKLGPDDTVAVSFVPTEPGEHLLSVKKDRKHVPNSPFSIIVEAAKEAPTEPTVGHECDVNLEIPNLKLPDDLKHIKAELERPNGKRRPLDVGIGPNDTLSVPFTPTEPGKHLLHVKKRGSPVKGSPFPIMVVDGAPGKKKPVPVDDEEIIPMEEEREVESAPPGDEEDLSGLPSVGNPCNVSLEIPNIKIPDDIKLLKGTLTRPTKQSEPLNITEGPDETVSMNFVPTEPGLHVIDVTKRDTITRRDKPIKDSPFNIMVVEGVKPKPKKEEEPVIVGQLSHPCFDSPDVNIPDDLPVLSGVLSRPSGKEEPVDVTEGPNKTLSCAFTPEEPGEHILQVKKRRKPIANSPFKVNAVEEAPKEDVPKAGSPCQVGVPAKGLDIPKDIPELRGVLEKPNGDEEPLDVKEGPNKTLAVDFTPKEPGKHLVHIKKGRRPIDGSPFQVSVEPAEEKAPKVGNPCELGIAPKGLDIPRDLSDLRGILEKPNGDEVPLDVKEGPNKTIAVDFTPTEPGKHLVHIKKGRRPIDDSPFVVVVEPSEEKAPTVGSPCDVGIPVKGLDIPRDLPELRGILERPDGKEESLDVKEGPNKTLAVNFTPKTTGKHLVHIKKGRRPVDGSPFTVIVESAAPVEEEAPSEGAPTVGSPCDVGIPAKGLDIPRDLPELRGVLERPDGKEEPLDVKEGPNKTLAVNFTPKLPGKHLVHIKKGRRPIDGSPFVVFVESVEEKAQAPKVGSPCELGIAPKGLDIPRDLPELRGVLERPDGKEEPLDVKEGPNKTLAVDFTPKEPGKHLVHIKKGRRPIDDSPFVVVVESAPAEEKIPKVGSPCQVGIPSKGLDIPRDIPELRGVLERPDGKEEPVDVKEGPNKTLSVNFTPRQPGKHLLHIKKGRRPIDGSPFEVIVESAPKVGKQCDVGIPVEGLSLPGDLPELRGTLERPNGVEESVDVFCNPDNTGLDVSFVPKEAGKHLIHIKKGRRPITGSPFEVIIDASAPKVGSPCDVGFPADDLNLPGDLSELRGIIERPNGVEEPLDVKCGPDNATLAISFEPKEAGKHLIHIKKGRRPITGSPFEVVVDAAAPKVGSPCDVSMPADDLNLPADLSELRGLLERPNGEEEPVDVQAGPDNTLSASFVPKEPGDHKIHIKKGRRPIKGSPFIVVVSPGAAPKAGAPKVGSPTNVGLPAKGLKLPDDLPDLKGVLARPSGKEEPVDVGAGPNDTLSVAFTPEEPGEHLLHIKKRRQPIDGSPFRIIVEESVPEEKVPTVGNPCDVCLDVAGINLPEDLAHITGAIEKPSGKQEPVDVKAGPNNSLSVTFVPEEPGKHLLHIKKRRSPVKGSPFPIMVEEGAPKGQAPSVGSPCDVNLDIPGIVIPGDLSVLKGVLSRPNGKKETLDLRAGPGDTLSMNFTPKEPGVHEIVITKNGREVRGSPFKVIVEEGVEQDKLPTVGNECDLSLSIPGINLPKDLRYLTGLLKRPSQSTEEPLNIKSNDENALCVSFVPNEPGKHLVSIKKDGKHVASSPFTILVDQAPEADKGPTTGSPCNVAIELEGVRIPQDLRYLDVTLTRPDQKREEPLQAVAGPDNTLSVNFTPDEPGKYYINIRRDRKHVPSSPIEVIVKAAKPRKPGEPNKIGLEIPGLKLPDDLRFLKASVTAPSGAEEPCDLSPGPNNRTIIVSFIPKEAGEHKLNIKKSGRHVGQSPYKVIVKPEDVAQSKPDASKVKANGKGLKGAPLGEVCDFVVDTSEAGYGGLGLSVEGPSKIEINCVDNENGSCTVDFKPAEPGTYLVNITYAEEHIPGSPYKCVITDTRPKKGGRRPVVDDEEISVEVQGTEESTPDFTDSFSDILAFPSSKGQPPQDFTIKYSGRSSDMKATVTRPSGKEDDAELISAGRDTYTVRFVPRETGEHLVNVKCFRKHIPGSPFKVFVEAPDGGAKVCRASGLGLDRAVSGEPCRFTVVTRDAGPGGLAVAVEGPAKAEINCHDNGDGSCDITWYPVEPGEYTVHVRFADEAIPNSPFTVIVAPSDSGSAMSMAQFKEQDLKVGQAASFAVQMKGKVGKLTASVIQPSGSQIECTVIEIDQGNYAVRFVPKEYGDHLVNVFLNKQHIPGSPFKVKVGGVEGGDPGKVRAYGPGLQGGVANASATFTVNALDAGSGALALSIDGPAKVKMNCVEQQDGTYLVTYNPTVSGSYEISVRFAGEHIPASPYKVRIVGEGEASSLGDPSKVTTGGTGLNRAVIGKPNTFTIDASNAGRGSIMVGVEGPAIPAKEIVVKHTGGSVYSVNYTLEERGNYVLKVLWADCHIPGSPFHVTV